jgi:hypothetical protein
VPEAERRPAYYAATRGGWRDWWTLLHPPYTAWHLSYVVVGACLAPRVETSRLIATVLAFFLAVGVAAHAVDELHGRPLGTTISSGALIAVTAAGLSGAVVLGVVGITKVGLVLVPFIVVGPLLVLAYNAELFGGIVHTTPGFAAAWGAFPVLTGYVAQTSDMALGAVLAAAGAFALSWAQRALSTPARRIRRSTRSVEGSLTLADGTVVTLDEQSLLAPLETALRAISWGMIALATALAVARLT